VISGVSALSGLSAIGMIASMELGNDMISVILAEDHHMVREGFKRLLAEHSRIRVLADVGDGRDALELVDRLKADILLLDLAIPGLNGLEVIRRLQGKHIKILVVSMHADEARVIEALKSGASGYVLKDSSATELIEAIETVAKGLPFITQKILVDGRLEDWNLGPKIGRPHSP